MGMLFIFNFAVVFSLKYFSFHLVSAINMRFLGAANKSVYMYWRTEASWTRRQTVKNEKNVRKLLCKFWQGASLRRDHSGCSGFSGHSGFPDIADIWLFRLSSGSSFLVVEIFSGRYCNLKKKSAPNNLPL
jgi:hypothetical protein